LTGRPSNPLQLARILGDQWALAGRGRPFKWWTGLQL